MSSRAIQRISEIPLLHLIMIALPFFIVVLCLIFMEFGKTDHVQYYQNTANYCMVFIFGKLTNGFGKPVLPDPSVSLPATRTKSEEN
jgi:hypothetical protein